MSLRDAYRPFFCNVLLTAELTLGSEKKSGRARSFVHLSPGLSDGITAKTSVQRMKQQRMEDGTWLMYDLRFKLIIKPLRIVNVRTEGTITRSDFHKFVVDSRILDLK